MCLLVAALIQQSGARVGDMRSFSFGDYGGDLEDLEFALKKVGQTMPNRRNPWNIATKRKHVRGGRLGGSDPSSTAAEEGRQGTCRADLRPFGGLSQAVQELSTKLLGPHRPCRFLHMRVTF